jgi:hypothetical protein
VPLEGLCQRKLPETPLEIEPATFQLLAQCLNQLRHCEAALSVTEYWLQVRCGINFFPKIPNSKLSKDKNNHCLFLCL